jgi:hypothetical protein
VPEPALEHGTARCCVTLPHPALQLEVVARAAVSVATRGKPAATLVLAGLTRAALAVDAPATLAHDLRQLIVPDAVVSVFARETVELYPTRAEAEEAMRQAVADDPEWRRVSERRAESYAAGPLSIRAP